MSPVIARARARHVNRDFAVLLTLSESMRFRIRMKIVGLGAADGDEEKDQAEESFHGRSFLAYRHNLSSIPSAIDSGGAGSHAALGSGDVSIT